MNDYINYVQPGAKVVYNEIAPICRVVTDYSDGTRIIIQRNDIIIENQKNGNIKLKRPTTDKEKQELENLVNTAFIAM